MNDDGHWSDWEFPKLKGSTLRVGPVFRGEVSYPVEINGKAYWVATLNGERLSGYATLEAAKARVDWEIWNRVRLMRPGYLKILERRESWETESKGAKKIVP